MIRYIAILSGFIFLQLVVVTVVRAGERVVGYKPKLVKVEEIKQSFKDLKPMMASLNEKYTMTLYEGLPHQTWNYDDLQSELKHKKTITRYGFPFYQKANPISAEDAKLVRELVQKSSSFRVFGGYKFCGGYHPDFSLVWKQGETAIEMQVCFGCHEIKVYQGKTEVYCDIRRDAYAQLEKILKKYHTQRPKMKIE